MTLFRIVASGFVGALALTLLHETMRRVLPNAPRLDILGMRSLAQGLRRIEVEPPHGKALPRSALAGDLLTNTLLYSLIGLSDRRGSLWRGAVLGALAGLGGILLPRWLGLGSALSARTRSTALMTISWYLAGGVAAGLVNRNLALAPLTQSVVGRTAWRKG